jgi:hypothetical protein
MPQTATLEILSGWKDIARHLGKGVRSVQRYERELGLPIRRPSGKIRGSVIATKAELDAWVLASPIREVFQLPQSLVDNATPLAEFRRHVTELRQLRNEAMELRASIGQSLQMLEKNLNIALQLHRRSHERTPVDALPSHPVNLIQ